MSGITSQEEFLQKIKEQVEKEKEPSTVFGHGWNPNGFETEGLEEKAEWKHIRIGQLSYLQQTAAHA